MSPPPWLRRWRAFAAWSASSIESRALLLDRIHSLILERARAVRPGDLSGDGRCHRALRAAHRCRPRRQHIRVARDNARGYAFVTHRGDMAIVREAIGVCGLITPWNWPLYQITAKVGPALAAGCTVVLKPSELSPLSALLFAEVMHDAGTPPGVFNLVNGSGPAVGAALAEHPDVDMISITGSTRAGVLVAQAAAPTVKRVAQELGGKSPNLILPDAELARAVPRRRGGRLPQRRPILQRADAHDRASRAPRKRSNGSRSKRHPASSWAIRVRSRPRTARWQTARSSIACRK